MTKKVFDKRLAQAEAADPGFGTEDWALRNLGAHFDEMFTPDQLNDPRIVAARAEIVGQQVRIVNRSTDEGVK